VPPIERKERDGKTQPLRLEANNLLRALHPTDFDALKPVLQRIHLERGTVIYKPGDNVHFAYFPCGPSLASFLIMLENGKSAETALVGREGAIGGIVSQGRLPAYAQSAVLFPGEFLRIEIAALEEAKSRSFPLRYLFARYADCLLAQIFQSVACNAAHSIEQRTAKWLLAAIERTGSQNIVVNQDQLASVLGVGRSYLSRIVQTLKSRRILRTQRGMLAVNDLPALERLACGCHEAVRRHFEEVLQGVYPGEEGLAS
jgi:CRP-like cAMP-binding protein